MKIVESDGGIKQGFIGKIAVILIILTEESDIWMGMGQYGGQIQKITIRYDTTSYQNKKLLVNS